MSCANALATITMVMVQGLGITDTAELLLGGKAMSEAPFQKIYTKERNSKFDPWIEVLSLPAAQLWRAAGAEM